MKSEFYVDDRYISFAAFDLFAEISHMRLKINDGSDSVHRLPYIESLEFLEREKEGDHLITFKRLKARCTEIWESKILKYCSSNPAEDRPDGKWWKEPYRDSLTGDPEYKYYRVYAYEGKLFENAFVFKNYQSTEKYHIYLIFSKEDLIARTFDDTWKILIPMTPSEINRRISEADEAQRELKAIFTDYPPHTGDYPPEDDLFPRNSNEADDWMDNPEDYWNID